MNYTREKCQAGRSFQNIIGGYNCIGYHNTIWNKFRCRFNNVKIQRPNEYGMLITKGQ